MVDFDVLETIVQFERSQQFTDWKKQHADAFLASFVATLDKHEVVETVQFNYSLPESKEVFTFSPNQPEVVVGPTLNKAVPQPLMLPTELSFEKAMQAAHTEKEKQHPKELVLKIVVILQTSDKASLWNIAFITASFKTIQVHVLFDNTVSYYDCGTFIQMS